MVVFAIGGSVSFIYNNPTSIFHKDDTIHTGVVITAKDNYAIIYSKGERIYLPYKSNSFEVLDIVKVEGKKEDFDFTRIESSFDFENYLNNKGVFKQIDTKNYKLILKNPIRLKKFKEDFLNSFNEEARSIVGSILFSINDESEIHDSLKALHLTKLMSTSGLFIYAFIHLLEKLFILVKLKDKVSDILIDIILFPLLIFSFPKFTLIKILFIRIFRQINKYALKSHFSHLEIISLSGIFFLLINCFYAYQTSFILGFLLPLFFIYSNSIYRKKKKWKKRIFQILLTYIFMIPFELNFFNSISPLTVIFELILAPYFELIALLSLPVLFFNKVGFLINYLVIPIRFILEPFLFINIEIYGPPLVPIGYVIYYSLFLSFVYYLSIKFKPIYKTIGIVYTTLVCFYFIPIKNTLSESVSFINVGQGDSCLIRKGNKTILIDTGGNIYIDIGKECLIPYLKKKRIYTIDTVITTHDDFDHCGALDSLRENFRVKNYINAASSFPLNSCGITFLNYNNHVGENLKDENYQSLVIGFTLHRKSYLIMGDAPIAIERKIMKEYENIPCDVLKIGHHGSNTSSCPEFISYISPKEVVVSVGENNKYGHPHQSVLDLLNQRKIKIKRTDILGTITYFNYIFM